MNSPIRIAIPEENKLGPFGSREFWFGASTGAATAALATVVSSPFSVYLAGMAVAIAIAAHATFSRGGGGD